jgi:hypothetical protein
MARFQIVLEESGGSQFVLFDSSQPGGPTIQGQPLVEGETIVFRGRRWYVGLEPPTGPPDPAAPPRFRLQPAA